jgi:hypothetical protein
VRRLVPLVTLIASLLLLPAAAHASKSQSMMFEAPRELQSDDAALRAQTLDEIKGFGVNWVRVVVYWRDVAPDADSREVPDFDETDPNAYPGWGKYDRMIQEIKARGMNPMVTVTGPVPRWATEFKSDQVTRPEPARFERFFEATIKRYSMVRYFAVWNEPNHPDFLQPQYSGQGERREVASGKIYRRLFQAATDARDSVRPDVRLLIGETAPRGNSNVAAPLEFFRATLCMTEDYKKRSYCEELDAHAYAHHPYTTKSGPWFVPSQRDDVTIGSLNRLNSALARAGEQDALRRGMTIWATEFGIQSIPDPQGVSETAQAEYRAVGERMGWNNGRVRMFAQYLMRDSDPIEGVSDAERFGGFESGLRNNNGDLKRAYLGFPVPMVAKKVGRERIRTYMWGLVRPAAGATRVAIEYTSKEGPWRYLKQDTTDSRGYWVTNTTFVNDRRYRVRWTAPDGTERVGPLTRVYDR